MMVSNFFFTIVDDFSRTTWVYLLRTKSEVKNCLLSFYNLVETQFGVKVKILRSDNGAEFHLTKFLNEKGIIHNDLALRPHNKIG